jgi:hypothetical protein
LILRNISMYFYVHYVNIHYIGNTLEVTTTVLNDLLNFPQNLITLISNSLENRKPLFFVFFFTFRNPLEVK